MLLDVRRIGGVARHDDADGPVFVVVAGFLAFVVRDLRAFPVGTQFDDLGEQDVSGKALAAGLSPQLSAVHPILRLQNVDRDLLHIVISINELNIAAPSSKLSHSESNSHLAAIHESHSL